jgi:hypothetical protein
MMAEYEALPGAIGLESGPYVIVRPEGDWDRPGILESSTERKAREAQDNIARKLRSAVGT